MSNPVGETQNEVFRVDFDRRVTMQFRGSVVTSDAGLLAYRELDDALGLSTAAGEALADARTGKNGRHALIGMLRQSVFGRLAGYEDVNDAERLRQDPAMRWIVGGKAAKGRAASPSQMGRFETRWLAAPGNLRALADLSGRWIDRVRASRAVDEVILDMDSSVSPTHGEQEQSVWNGHFGCTCYHPLFVFNQFGDLERCALRPGNVHSADGWEQVLKPVVARYRGTVRRIGFRGDAAFAQPNMYEFLEAEGIDYAIRLPANQVLQERMAICSSGQLGDQRITFNGSTEASGTRPQAGPILAGLSPRWSGTMASCFLASDSSSRICATHRRTLSAFTISAGPASNGSRKGKARSSGHAFRVARSTQTRSGFNSMRWRTISGTSFVRSQHPRRSKIGRSPVCARSSSRSARRSSGMADMSPSKWRRSPSRVVYSPTSWG